MRIKIAESVIPAIAQLGFEVVERKGIGHPDSLADLVAEEFSVRYSRYGLLRFGAVPNHWVDKVALVGAGTHVEFGGYTVNKPITAYLFGKITPMVGGERIPIDGLFRATVRDVLAAATRYAAILDHIRYRIENTFGTAPDHPHAFYRPRTVADCHDTLAELRANDTAFCTAYAPASPLERLAIDLENHVNSEFFATQFPMIGSDIKIMLTMADAEIGATTCLPFHPEHTESTASYRADLASATEALRRFVFDHTCGWSTAVRINIAVNTKDRGTGAYLTPFGTSLGKGDCGLVGRGNKTNGVIPAVRCTGVEALAGKNPLHHTGKLYTLAASWIADRIFDRLGHQNEVVLVSRNGDALGSPVFVGVRLARDADGAARVGIAETVHDCLSDLQPLSRWLLDTSPLDRFRQPSMPVERSGCA